MEELGLKSKFVFQEKFGAGEPSEAMIETMYEAIPYLSLIHIYLLLERFQIRIFSAS